MNEIFVAPRVGLPLEKQKATVVACTPRRDGGWVVLCLRWQDFMPYVVWDAWVAEEGDEKSLICGNGHYAHKIGDAIYRYANRGGDVSPFDE